MSARPQWSTACLDWADRIVAGESIIPPPIYPEEAAAALEVFKSLRIPDLPGKPTFGEACGQWVFDFVAAVFGAYDAETGDQLIREFYLLISKKNTKSTLAAGIMLTALILCWREEEDHLILSPSKEIADNSFKPAAAMVRCDPDLSEIFNVQSHIRTITHRVKGNTLRVIAADSEAAAGKKAGRVLVDEHWLFGKQPNADAMFMEALGGQVSRNEGWVIYLTTQSDEEPKGVFSAKLEYYRAVRDGKTHDPKRLPVLYEFPPQMIEDEDYLRPEFFYITNPNMGLSVSQDWLIDEMRLQRESDEEGAFRKFLAKHLNIQIGMNLRAGRWAGAPLWDAAAKHKVLTPETLIAQCEVIEAGVDGGGLDDLLGLTLSGRTPAGKWLTWSHAWAHQSVLDRRKKEITQFEALVKAGDLTIVRVPGTDVVELAAFVALVHKAELLDKVGVDQRGLGGILDALDAAGIPFEKIVGISQGWKLSAAITTAERKLNEGVIEHAGQPMMTWCAGNAKVVPVGNAFNITKQASGSAKIDPLMSFFNTIELLSLNPKAMSKKFQMHVYG